MEIGKIGATFNTFPRTDKIKKNGNAPVDAFISSSESAKSDLADSFFENMKRIRAGDKNSFSIYRTADRDEQVMVATLKPDLGDRGRKFTGGIVPAGSDRFYGVTVNDDKHGKHVYKLTLIDRNGKVQEETELFRTETYSKVDLTGSGKNKVAVKTKDDLKIFEGGKLTGKVPITDNYGSRVLFGEDGTTYLYDKKKGPVDDFDRTNRLTAISPQGEVKWEKQIKSGYLRLDEKNGVCFHDNYKDLKVFNSDGSEEDFSRFAGAKDPIKDFIPAGNEGSFIVHRSSRAAIPDSLVMVKDGNEAFRVDAGRSFLDGVYDNKNRTLYSLVGEWRKNRIDARGLDGNVKWSVEIPDSSGSANHPIVLDKEGNLTIAINGMKENKDVPDSFSKMLGDFDAGLKNLKDASGILMSLSPDGKLRWAHKVKDKFVDRKNPVVCDDGTVVMGTDRSYFDLIAGGDSGKEILQEINDKIKEEAEAEKEARGEIKVDEKEKTVDIGGVTLPINRK